MDLTSILGVVVGIGFILWGQILEGGTIQQLTQLTAFLIVGGGTAGAVLLSFPADDLGYAGNVFQLVFFGSKVDYNEVIADIVKYATKARKEGVISLENDAKETDDPLLKMGLESVSDGADPSLVREMMEIQLTQMDERYGRAAKVWENAGAYSPTIGIMGAVLGLIQVMQNLSDPSKLGAGIAVAFVATIYGLAIANLICIPISMKAKNKAKQLIVSKEMILEGILAIQAGESPALIERKLQAFILDRKPDDE